MRTPTGLLAIGLVLAMVAMPFAAPPSPAVAGGQAGPICFERDKPPYCIEDPQFQDYFNRRGGVRTLGYPVSRAFTLEGFKVQIFQRVVLQVQGGTVARLNLLDEGVMPLTHANQSVFPAPDSSLAGRAPKPDDPQYAQKAVDFIRATSPNDWEGVHVGFQELFNGTVPVDQAFPSGGANPDLLTLLNLEIWGLPTSQPTRDPGNRDFVYQRFQRGIMHYHANCNCSEGILIGDYFKAVLTGDHLPGDLAADMAGSRYFHQYHPGVDKSVDRPAELSATDMTGAFADDVHPPAAPAPTSPPVATTTPPTTPAPALLTGVLSGQVKPPDLSPDGLQVWLEEIPKQTVVQQAAYTLPDIPYGTYTLYVGATPQDQNEHPRVIIDQASVVLNIQLEPPGPGVPPVFQGKVVHADGTPGGTTVWRLGDAGRTTTDKDGKFTLVDTGARLDQNGSGSINQHGRLAAVSGDHWAISGFFQDTNATKSPLTVDLRLDKTGTQPRPPVLVCNFLATPADPSCASFQPSGGFLTARLKPGADSSAVQVSFVFNDRSTQPAATLNNRCDGCPFKAFVAALPTGKQGFRIAFTDPNGKPVTDLKSTFDELQVVRAK
jgi:hypothetical protein